MSVRLCVGKLSAPSRSGGSGARRLLWFRSAPVSSTSTASCPNGDCTAIGRRHNAHVHSCAAAASASDESARQGSSARPPSVGSSAVSTHKRLGRALQALRLEESRGHCDVRGARSLFSEYAASELTQLGDALPAGSVQERWRRTVAVGFARYRALSPAQRASLVEEAQQLLARDEPGRTRASRAATHRAASCSYPPLTVAPARQRQRKRHSSPHAERDAPTEPSGEFCRRETAAGETAGGRTGAEARAASAWKDGGAEGPHFTAAATPPTHATRRERGTSGGKAWIHGSDSWEMALAQNLEKREEVAAVGAAEAVAAPVGVREVAAVATPVEGSAEGTAGASFHASAEQDSVAASKSSPLDAQPQVPLPSGTHDLLLESQGGAAWHALRASRLTASSFSNALGFWRGGRNELWEEKLGLAAPFAGNEATDWGSSKENEALASYKRLTGADVSHMLFRVLSPDEAELWLGASPDGLIAATAASLPDDIDKGEDCSPGVLEIKCPWNKGRPESARPYPNVPWYYMPQVQGLMAVFDREWCDVYCYTVANGSTIYRVERDREYWAMMYRALSDFWWQSVVPGKHAKAAGGDPEKYRPQETHPLTEELKRRSRRLAEQAPVRKFGGGTR